MNCEELRNDIDRLKGLKEALGQKLDALNETGKGVVEVRKLREETGTASDEILEKYLDDFKEQNPEISKIRLGERIKGFEGNIESIAALPDGSVLVGGWDSYNYYNNDYEWEELKQFTLKDGKWEPKEIGGFDSNIYSIAALPDGSALVGGERGKLKQFTLKDGGWELEMIRGFDSIIYSIAALPDGSALVGGWAGELKQFTLKDGEWEPKEIGGFKGAVYSIAALPDGSVLVGGGDGELKQITLKNGEWEPEKIEGFKGDIYSIAALPDGSVLVGGRYKDNMGTSHPELKQFTLKDGEWEPEKIEGFERIIRSIAALPDGSALAGGTRGELYSTTSCFCPPTVEDLKSQLDEIIKKGKE